MSLGRHAVEIWIANHLLARLHQWTENGTWKRMWKALFSQLDAQSKIEWAQAFLDGSFVPSKKGGLK
jgi:hypothetical protein